MNAGSGSAGECVWLPNESYSKKLFSRGPERNAESRKRKARAVSFRKSLTCQLSAFGFPLLNLEYENWFLR